MPSAAPGFSFYACGDDWSSEWVVNRVDCSADSEGSTRWTDTRTGPDGNGAVAMHLATDRAGSLYVVGRDFTHGGDIYPVRYSPDGAVLWEKSWDGPAHLSDWPCGIAVTGSGTVYVAGATGKAAGYDDAVLLKYTTAGRRKWKYIVTTALCDAFYGVAADSKGNAYVTGQRAGTVGLSTMVTNKVDPYGKRVWQRSIAGLAIACSGEFVKVKGSAVCVGGTLYKREKWPLAAKYSLAGKRAWAWTEGGPVESVDDMTVDSQGRVVLIGTVETSVGGSPLTTAWVYMLDADGSPEPYGTTCYADYDPAYYPVVFHDVTNDANDNIYLSGSWHTDGTGNEGNALVARIPSLDTPGSQFKMEKIWRYDGPASGLDGFASILVQPGNGIFAAGTWNGGSAWQAVAHRIEP